MDISRPQITLYLMLLIDNISYGRDFRIGKVICLRIGLTPAFSRISFALDRPIP